MIKAIVREIHRVTRYSSVVGMFMLVIMMFLTTADAISRKILVPITGTFELDIIMLVVFGMLGLGYVQQMEGHVSIGLLTQRMPLRVQYLLNSVMSLITLVVLAFLFWKAWDLSIVTLRGGTESDLLHIPMYPFRFLVCVGVFFLWLEFLITLVDSVNKALKVSNPDKGVAV